MSRTAPLDQDVSGIVRTTMTGAPSSEGSERVTVSSVPISRESVVSVNSAVDVEAAWLDRLVVAACEMPVAEGETADRAVHGALARRDLPRLRSRRLPRSADPRRADLVPRHAADARSGGAAALQVRPRGRGAPRRRHGPDAPLPRLRVRACARASTRPRRSTSRATTPSSRTTTLPSCTSSGALRSPWGAGSASRAATRRRPRTPATSARSTRTWCRPRSSRASVRSPPASCTS